MALLPQQLRVADIVQQRLVTTVRDDVIDMNSQPAPELQRLATARTVRPTLTQPPLDAPQPKPLPLGPIAAFVAVSSLFTLRRAMLTRPVVCDLVAA